jgi:hypothetical protein
MVAAELEADNEDDLFGIVDDVRGFLNRKEGLPAYISRQHIFEEFSRSDFSRHSYFGSATRVARWFVFKPKKTIWVHFGGP